MSEPLFGLSKMILRLGAILVSLGCLAVAGPVTWDDSKCAQECNGGSKYQYSPQTSYIYSYESSNELKADRTSDLFTRLKATVKITVISQCEMVLELTDVDSGTSASLSEDLQRNPLPFSFDSGNIDHVCPNPEDSDEVNNIKKAILSSFQNTMRSFDFGAFNGDTDILGTCDTTYKSREKGPEKFEIVKTKNIPTCSNHLKGQSLLLASFYQSGANRQHLPFLSNEEFACKQIIDNGIVDEVTCDESAVYKPLGEYGYVVTAISHSTLKKLSSQPASRVIYKAQKKESLVFKHDIQMKKNPNAESEARSILSHICENSKDLINKEVASSLHKLVYTIRQMDAQSVENIYSAFKNNEICRGNKPKTLYLDALRMSSSGGAIALLTKLTSNGEISKIDSLLWFTLLPFTSYVEEESVAAAVPLLRKDTANRQTLLGVSALAYKYCSLNPECESTQAIKDLSSALTQFLGDKCNAKSQAEQDEILTALKAFGNLGYFGEKSDNLLECALEKSNKKALRIAAIDAYRRSPCKQESLSKLLEIYTNKAEHDELRIAALKSLSKCSTKEIMKRLVDSYSSETSNQVRVYTWLFLENLRTSSDPAKSKLRKYLMFAELKRPSSIDLTKFSWNSEVSPFSEILNVGISREGNLIHSEDSFIPRSMSAAWKLNLFGNQLETFEYGYRVEDLEHILEKLFGPTGIVSSVDLEDLFENVPEYLKRFKRAAESYQGKIDALHDRVGYKRDTVPHGSAFIRILGHELGLLHLNAESLKRVMGIKANDLLKNIPNLRNVDVSRMLFINPTVLFPSITGRAYKLALNGSIALGLKGDGKMDLRQPTFPIPRVDIDGTFKPSVLVEASSSLTIHSESYQPGVQAETVLSAGLDYKTKLEIKDGRLIHVKLTREKQRSEIFNMKRTLYYMNKGGKIEMEKLPSHTLNYCTKYLQKITGARYCSSFTFLHAFQDGKFKFPFVREMEASLVVEQTDPSMNGYEFLLEIPEFGKVEERRFRFLVDTPNSQHDRKFALELNLKQPDDTTCHLTTSLHTPFYTLDSNSHVVNRDDQFRLNTEITGDGRRRYSVIIEAVKIVKGARLVEYQPKITLSLPSTRPVELTGKVVYTKGTKPLITVNLESRSFDSPFTIKGSLAKEGESINLSSNWKLNYEFNTNMFSQIHRTHNSIGYDVEKGMFIDIGHHYEPDGRSYESVTSNTKIDNIKIFERLSFRIDSETLFAEHQDLNSMLKWDFSFKPLHHLKSDLIFNYGENFQDHKHLVRSTIVSALHGDFYSFQKMSIENKIGLTVGCLDFDKSASLSATWDLVDDIKLVVDAGIRREEDQEIKLDLNYRHLQKKPLKVATDFTFIYNTYNFKYKSETDEVAPGEYKYMSVTEPSKGKEVKADFVYRIKSNGDLHHEMEGTVQFPGFPQPVQQKGVFKMNRGRVDMNSQTNFGRGNVYVIDLKLDKDGANEIRLNTPFVEGNLMVDASSPVRSIQADLRSKKGDSRRIILSGKVTPGDTNSLDLDVQWDADRDPEKKVHVELTSNIEVEEGIEKYIIGGSVNYGNTIDLSGTISTDLIRGPHFFRAEFSGNMEPMAVEIEHEIKKGEMTSLIRFLRSGVEKIRSDIRGKLIRRGFSHFEIEGGIFTASPYKTFDGKSLFFRIFADSVDAARMFIAEYRLKFSPAIGYEGKFDYERKRGFPGYIRSNLLVTVHNRPLYEGNTQVDYGNGKYSWKTNFTPISRKKINFLASFEHSARFAAFRHNLVTSLKYLQTIDANAVADLRNMEDAKVHINADVNSHKLYDINGTLKMRSVIDFDAEATLFSKITPSLKIYSKAQTSNQVTKYDFNLNVDSKDVITGSGEIKKRKKSFSGDLVFKYKEKQILEVNIQQDGKGKHERNTAVTLKFPSRTYTANVKVNRDKKDDTKTVSYDTKFCRNDLCVEIDATNKEYDHTSEWQIAYKRGDLQFNIERIRESSREVERFHTVIYKGDKRFGYDVRFGSEGPGRSLSLGLILPSRKIVTKTTVEFSLSKPRVKLEFSADERNHPGRTLGVDVRFENHLWDSSPSKFDITITHPIFEKPIEIELSGDYEPDSEKYFTATGSLDYSSDPEDKLLGKLSLEEIPGGSDVILINLYHKDEQHLDFVIKINGTSNENEDSFAVVYNWKDENGADTEAYIVGSYPKNEKRFYFAYQRPKLSYRLEGKITTPESLLSNTCEVDLESVYNGETTKGKLVSDYGTGCHKLTMLSHEGEPSRIVQLCINLSSRKLFSLLTESMDEDGQWSFDYLLEIVQKNYNTIGARQQVNPDFLGEKLFLVTSLLDELDEAGVGTLPFYDSPRFKIIRNSFSSKVFEPAKAFVIPEVQKFIKDMQTDSVILQNALIVYYSKLPSLDAVKERVQEVRKFVRAIAYEIWLNVYSYYESYVQRILGYIDKVKEFAQEKCDSSRDCKSLVNSYQRGGWKGLCEELKNFLYSLPEKIEEFLESPSEEFRNYLTSAFNILKGILQPLTKYRCGEIVVKIVQLSYEWLQPRVQYLFSRVPNYYKIIKERLISSEYFKVSVEILKDAYFRIKERVLSIDYKKVVAIVRKHFEDYLLTLSPPSRKQLFTINAINAEKGIVDIDFYTNIVSKIGQRIRTTTWDIVTKSVDSAIDFNPNVFLIKLKRALDLGYLPPYDSQAMIVGHHHFVTFDKVFYDFEGECTYLLSRDFQDGNFTLALKPKADDHAPSILVLKGDTAVEISCGQTKSVKVGSQGVELPYLAKDLSVIREGNTIAVDTKNGVQVKCNLVHEVCTFEVAGWYFGKTAGLLGKYNYEEYDEFQRPKGQIANSVTAFAKSWELEKNCKTKNLVKEVQINKNSDYYKLCRTHFVESTSPLAACYSEVPADEYFSLCLRHLASESNHKKALCTVATAYVRECEKNYVELNLPPKCLTCDAPGGSKLEHGDRKKFEKLDKKATQTVFVVEDHECNKVLARDLSNLARSMEKELENKGYRENSFGLIGYGGEIGEPQIFTTEDKIFFGSRDINAITERFKMESKKEEASRAFEAIKHAVTHLFRGDAAKSVVLLSCSACKYDFRSLLYPVVQQILLERGISLHVIRNTEIPIRKSSSKEKNIIGVDPDTVFHTKDATQRELVGEPSLRSQVVMPKDLCIALSQDVNGSYFSTHPIRESSSAEIKNWRNVFARKFLSSTQLYSCQWCDCTSTRDHLPNTVCQPCEMRRPRLPFSVGLPPNAYTRTLEAFISYLLRLLRE